MQNQPPLGAAAAGNKRDHGQQGFSGEAMQNQPPLGAAAAGNKRDHGQQTHGVRAVPAKLLIDNQDPFIKQPV